MAQAVSQVLGNTHSALTFLHTAVTKSLGAAEKGSITRGFDAFDACYLAIGIVLVLAVLGIMALVWVSLHDRKIARLQARVLPYAFAEDTADQTVNMKGNR
jgi:hypothetical protein